jgi:hypothetical protein
VSQRVFLRARCCSPAAVGDRHQNPIVDQRAGEAALIARLRRNSIQRCKSTMKRAPSTKRGSQAAPLGDFSCLTSASKGSMTVQWALLHPRGPQDDRAIAKRFCGTRDRSACAFQHLPHPAPTDGQVHTSRRGQSFSRDAFHGFFKSGSRP